MITRDALIDRKLKELGKYIYTEALAQYSDLEMVDNKAAIKLAQESFRLAEIFYKEEAKLSTPSL